MIRRIAALFLAFLLLFCAAIAEENAEIIEYTGGGIVSRRSAAARALISELDVAYFSLGETHLMLNQEAEFTAYVTGGDGIYSYEFNIFKPTGDGNQYISIPSKKQAKSADNVYRVTVEEENRYVVQAVIWDASGNNVVFQSQVFETASEEEYLDENTVPGKVAALAAQCIQEAKSDYARALWLHDWLIENAEYDTSYTNYFADGVLLQHKGVCQSYALAYEMLLKEVGIESIYITGTAGGVRHAWNLVKLGGEWYHVDCTWDDPTPNGNENHIYFAVTDDFIARNHSWASEWEYMPDCSAERYSYTLRSGMVHVHDQTSLEAAFAKVVGNKLPYAEFLYVGTDSEFVMSTQLIALINAAMNDGSISARSYEGTTDNLRVAFGYDGDYPPTPEGPLWIELYEDRIVLLEGEAHIFDMEYGPAKILQWKDEGDGSRSMVWVDLDDISFDIEWSSSDGDVAHISDGEVYALCAGEAEIMVRAGDAQSVCRIKVLPAGGEALVLPVSVKEIGEKAFLNCVDAVSVAIPDGATYIGSRAFDGCANLREISIPASVITIEEDAFGDNYWTTVICAENSAAHNLALRKGMPFILE